MYIRKAAELFGVTRTREIYEKAIEMLPESDAAKICLQYAQLEVCLCFATIAAWHRQHD